MVVLNFTYSFFIMKLKREPIRKCMLMLRGVIRIVGKSFSSVLFFCLGCGVIFFSFLSFFIYPNFPFWGIFKEPTVK